MLSAMGSIIFNVKYAREPRILNVEMTDFIHDGEAVRSAQRDACLSKNRPNRSGRFASAKNHTQYGIGLKFIIN